MTLAAVDPGAPQYFWKNVVGMSPSGRTVTIDNVDGGPGAPSNVGGSGESDLDVEQSGGVAPDANVVVYQAPNTDPGFADAFFTAASQNIAGSVSASWGESETYLTAAIAAGIETSAYMAAFDEAFLEMAVQGQSAFASAGDDGAYDAYDDIGTTNLVRRHARRQPLHHVELAAPRCPGRAPSAGPRGSPPSACSQQRAWGWDYLWPAFAVTDGHHREAGRPRTRRTTAAVAVASASCTTRPPYQQGVSGTNEYTAVPYLVPKDYVTHRRQQLADEVEVRPRHPASGRVRPRGRAEPDVSADADPFTGYLLYSPSFAQAGDPVLEGGWGGTSFVGPQLNGSTAVMESYLGHRVGFWNPSIYKFAQQKNSPFIPLQQIGHDERQPVLLGEPRGGLQRRAPGWARRTSRHSRSTSVASRRDDPGRTLRRPARVIASREHESKRVDRGHVGHEERSGTECEGAGHLGRRETWTPAWDPALPPPLGHGSLSLSTARRERFGERPLANSVSAPSGHNVGAVSCGVPNFIAPGALRWQSRTRWRSSSWSV